MAEIQRTKNDSIFTDEQWDAIAARDTNILVSAAAGSGKTAVLVRRITKMIIEDHVPIDRMLIVTFTKAAASEMKEKITRSIHEEIESGSPDEDNLRHQLDIMYRAHISTFDSFAFEVVKRYFHLVECDSDLSVCDENDAAVMKADAMDDIFEEMFDEEREGFEDFLAHYSSFKNDDSIKSGMIKLYDSIRSIPDYMDWLENAADMLDMSEEEFRNSELAVIMMRDIDELLLKALRTYESVVKLAEDSGIEHQLPVLRQDPINVQTLLEIKDMDQLGRALEAFSQPALSRVKKNVSDASLGAYDLHKGEIQEGRKKAKAIIDGIRKKYFAEDIRSSIKRMNETYKYAVFLLSLLKKFEIKYNERKSENDQADFADIEHYAIKILKNKDAAYEYRSIIDYIFIDEYQDSNLLQERIIDSIKKDNNVFMVGDIKQSIYRFRLADPSIFQDKYDNYRKYDKPAGGNGSKIDLNRNFRSKDGVVTAVNDVFKDIMNGYDEDAELRKGVAYTGDMEYKTEFAVVDCADEATEGIDQELLDMKKEELEALTAVSIINENAGHTNIWDVKQGRERVMRRGDIVILMRSAVNYADIFYQTLRDNGIDCYLENNGGYFEHIEVMTFMDLLRIIDNMRQDLPLLSVLRSPIFSFSIDDLIEIRRSEKGVPYHEAFLSYPENGRDAMLKKRVSEVVSSIMRWKKQQGYVPLDDFVWKLMGETGFYMYAGAMPGGEQRQAALRMLTEKAAYFRQRGSVTLYGFIRYIDNMRMRKIDMAQPKITSDSDDTVRIMTVHKSKGLEFPMVIYAGLSRKFQKGSRERNWSFHNHIGIGLRYSDPEGHWTKDTLMKAVIDGANSHEEMDEEKRLMYVAFTRAEDKLVLLASSDDWEKAGESYEMGPMGESCALDLIYPSVLDHPDDFIQRVYTRHDLMMSASEDNRESVSLIDTLHGKAMKNYIADPDASLKKTVDAKMSYVYQHSDDLQIKSKYSVTEMNADKKPVISLEEPRFISGEQTFTAAQKGTVMHTVMEQIDFSAVEKKLQEGSAAADEYIRGTVASMLENEILTKEESEVVETEKIRAFFETDTGKRACAAKKLYRELPFTVVHDLNGSSVLVQGIIDCCFEEDGEIVLIDYKTNHSREGIEDLYREQIDLYREAIETINEKPVKEAYLYLFSTNEFVDMID